MGGSYGMEAADVACCGTQRGPQPVAAGAQWFAVHTRYRFEKKVVAQLDQKDCEVYLPLLTERHTWSDREKVVTTPLFPGYAFVHIDQSRDAREVVLKTSGLIGFVSFGGLVATVPDKQIEDLQLLLREKERFSLHPYTCIGQRVRIREGALRGLEGVITKQEKGRVFISIEAIQRSLAIEIQGYGLELV